MSRQLCRGPPPQHRCHHLRQAFCVPGPSYNRRYRRRYQYKGHTCDATSTVHVTLKYSWYRVLHMTLPTQLRPVQRVKVRTWPGGELRSVTQGRIGWKAASP
eukprot:999630-Rhodomonas_salina.4